MKINKWTVGLAAAGLVSLPSVIQAEEKMNQMWTELSSTTISGYVNTSAHWNLGTGNANNPAYSFGGPGKSDGFNLDVVRLSIEKPLDEAQWAAGYKVDLLFGPDSNVVGGLGTQSTGTSSDFGIKQAYVALRAPVGNGLDFKMGVFDTVIGYEVFDAGSNPNYTRSYGYTIEPTEHTGLLASYQFCEFFSASVGIANSHGPAINARSNPPKAESYKTYLGSVAFTAPKDWGWVGGSTLYGCVINGFSATTKSGVGADQTSWYVGSTLSTPVEGLKLGAAYDYSGVSEQTNLGASSSYANAVSLYASFQATEKLSLHGRGEWFTQTDSAAIAGLPSKVFALTGTLQYDLWKNVISRVELRWDHQADGFGHAYGSSKPADDLGASRRNAYLVAANIIYKF